jgi:ParB family transcriptional regulator, chromosome partitioning protein
MAEEGKSRLGRGLAALIGDAGDEAAAIERTRSARRVPIEFVRPNPRNPRRAFGEEELDELAASIRERGIIQPILVRSVRGAVDAYEIVAGERRWRAAQRAGLHDVPIVLTEVGDREALEIAIIENVQRSDLNALEEAAGYAALMEEFGHQQDEVAKIVGKSRVHVTNTLRLLRLDESVKELMRAGKLTAGHARVLVNSARQGELADDIVRKGLSVRQAEALARRVAKGQSPRGAARRNDAAELAQRLSDTLGLVVRIDHRPGGSGVMTIRYSSLEQLDDVAAKLGAPRTVTALWHATADREGLPRDIEAAARQIMGESRRAAERMRREEQGIVGPRIRKL